MNPIIKKGMTKQIFAGSRLGVLALLVAGIASCGGDSAPSSEGDTSNFTGHDALIVNVANIMDDGFTQLATSTAALQTSIVTYCASVVGGAGGSAGDTAMHTAARNVFKTAMSNVQHSLVHGVGPALHNTQGTKAIYSWPRTSTCRIDHKQAENNAAVGLDITIRGMDALEYLLFIEPAADHSCPDTDVDPDLVTYNALDANVKQRRRCDYMINVIADVIVTADVLAAKWDGIPPDNYVATMTGTSSVTDTLNDVTDAMYYLASVVKDNKLDQPLGGEDTQTAPSCGLNVPCPEDVESPHALISLDNIRLNTVAFQTLFFGGVVADKTNNVGFDDWLEAEDGNRIIANKMDADLLLLLASIDALETAHGSLFHAINTDINAVNAMFDGPFQDVTRSFRDDVIPTLDLQLPQGSASDTD